MKNYISGTIFLALLVYKASVAQQPPTTPLPIPYPAYDVYTPKGQAVGDVIYVMEEMNTDWITYWNNWALLAYPNVDVIKYSSAHYNCHGFAWHVSEGGNERWIGSSTTTAEDTYWADGSYVETTSTNNHIKVSYRNSDPSQTADHSAITTSSSGVLRSKWRFGPLVEHNYNYCPYYVSGSYLKYYKLKSPTLSGSSTLICNNLQRTFTSDITEPNFTYNWNITSPLTEVSGDGTTAYTIASETQNGLSTLSLSITTPSGVIVSTNRNIWAGKPVISSISGPLSTPNYQWATYHANLQSTLSAPTDYTWILNPLNGNSVYDYGMSCDIAFYNTGSYQLIAQAQNVCGTGPYYVTGVYVYDTYSLMISPNPSTGETVLSIESTSKEKTFDADAEWEYEVYSDKQLLMQKQTSVKGASSTINTSGWKDGVYFIRVIYKGEVLQGKLVVKH